MVRDLQHKVEGTLHLKIFIIRAQDATDARVRFQPRAQLAIEALALEGLVDGLESVEAVDFTGPHGEGHGAVPGAVQQSQGVVGVVGLLKVHNQGRRVEACPRGRGPLEREIGVSRRTIRVDCGKAHFVVGQVGRRLVDGPHARLHHGRGGPGFLAVGQRQFKAV